MFDDYLTPYKLERPVLTPSGIHGMEAGDVIEIEIEGLGILRNTVI